MKKIKLFIYNYGSTELADFKNNSHVAIECLTALNDSLVKSYGALPEKIFYYLAYTSKAKNKIDMITFTGDKLGDFFTDQNNCLKKERANIEYAKKLTS